MKVKTDMDGEVAIIRLSGNLTGGPESDEVRGAIRRLLDGDTRKFIIDLKGVPWINSTGLGTLMAIYTSVQREEGVLKLAHVSDRIQSLFMITKLLTIFDTHPTTEEALAAF